MLGHLSFGVSDLERSIAFYDASLAPLGLTRVWTKTRARLRVQRRKYASTAPPTPRVGSHMPPRPPPCGHQVAISLGRWAPHTGLASPRGWPHRGFKRPPIAGVSVPGWFVRNVAPGF